MWDRIEKLFVNNLYVARQALD